MQNLFEDSCWVMSCLPLTNWLVRVVQNPYLIVMVYFFLKKMSFNISIDYILLSFFILPFWLYKILPTKCEYQQTLETKID